MVARAFREDVLFCFNDRLDIVGKVEQAFQLLEVAAESASFLDVTSSVFVVTTSLNTKVMATGTQLSYVYPTRSFW